jgi:hypothetical protein
MAVSLAFTFNPENKQLTFNIYFSNAKANTAINYLNRSLLLSSTEHSWPNYYFVKKVSEKLRGPVYNALPSDNATTSPH